MAQPAGLTSSSGLPSRLADVSAVTATPFGGDAIDLDGVARNARFLAEAGVRVIVCGGNTGEFYSLSPEELRAIVEATVSSVPSDTLVVSGAGYRPELAVRFAREGLSAGAGAVMLHYPIHPFVGEEGLARYYVEVAEGVEAPLVLYVRGPHLSQRVLEAVLAGAEIVCVKYAVADLVAFARLAAAAPELTWVCGLAETWAPFFWEAGARGFTSGLVNVAPALSLGLQAALRAGDRAEALRLWHQALPFEQLRARHGDANNVAVVKAALDLVGLAGGPPRPPLSALSGEDTAELERILAEWGLR